MRIVLAIVLSLYVLNTASAESIRDDPDNTDIMKLDFKQICQHYGYPVEQEIVTTEDGYQLKMFHISGGLDKPAGTNSGNKAILLQHGILDSSDCWLMHGRDMSPAFWLANQGYDVWLSNTRGNKYSREHKTISPKKKEFWEFSFEDMAKDVKANVDHVIEKTGQEKIAYMGHSQGTTQMFVAVSEDPDYYKTRISAFIAIGPVARLDHAKSTLLSILASVKGIFVTTAKTLGMYELFPANYLTTTAMRMMCGTFPILCKGVNILFADQNPFVDDSKMFADYMGHNPSGTSLKALNHFAQVMNAKKFQHFDYGKKQNRKVYGTDSPTEIPLANMNGVIPVALLVGKNDELGDVADCKWIEETIPDSITLHKVYNYGHLTFMIGKDMVYLHDVDDVLREHHPLQLVSE